MQYTTKSGVAITTTPGRLMMIVLGLVIVLGGPVVTQKVFSLQRGSEVDMLATFAVIMIGGVIGMLGFCLMLPKSAARKQLIE